MSKSQKRPWTAEEIEYLKDNVGLKSFDAIAKRLERSKSSVYHKAERLELGTYVENAEYLSINDIAEMLEVSYDTARNLVVNNKIKSISKTVYGAKHRFCAYEDVLEYKNAHPKRYRRRWTPQEGSRLKLYRELGLTVREIAERMGRTRREIEYRWVKMYTEERQKGARV